MGTMGNIPRFLGALELATSDLRAMLVAAE
jgi:hypothetical protein